MKEKVLAAAAALALLAGGAITASANTNTANINSTNAATGTTSGLGAATTATPPAFMDDRQFNTFTTGRWDTNGDGIISSTEWNTATPSWFGSNADISAFTAWDSNGDGYLNDVELQSFHADSGFYQMYDLNRDGRLDSAETANIPAR